MVSNRFFTVNIVFRREYFFVILIFLVVGFFYGWLKTDKKIPTTTLLPSAISGKTIVIDAGHGGRDPGAIGRTGLKEKDVNLDIAVRLKKYFSRVGVYVIMTREEDLDYGGENGATNLSKKRRDLVYRVKMANNSKADLLLSIHVNSFPQSIWSGAQCFYDSKNSKSKLLAEAIQRSLVTKLGPNRRKAKSADYMILKNTNMPSVTVEVGFISNPREEEFLADAEYREKLAAAIFYGTAEYLSEQVTESPSPVIAGKNQRGKVYPKPPPSPLSPGTARLFFATPNNEDLEFYPEEREIAGLEKGKNLESGKKILEELLRGPGEGSALLPCLPPGDWIRSIRLEGKRAIIDLSSELGEIIDGGGASELMAIYSLVNTLAINLELEEVIILVDGEKSSTLGGHFLLDEPLTPRPELAETEDLSKE
jgi:N-acetylmuramoyl-L-alanine amidase